VAHDKIFRTGDDVPVNGTYKIFHPHHLPAKQVALFKTEIFPKCRCCDIPVTFVLHRDVPALDYVNNLQIRMPLIELQPLGQDDSAVDSSCMNLVAEDPASHGPNQEGNKAMKSKV
jgi:hypothetical protein